MDTIFDYQAYVEQFTLSQQIEWETTEPSLVLGEAEWQYILIGLIIVYICGIFVAEKPKPKTADGANK